mmetsp:Transcript_74615/g.177619  ORF Transcript_74615/g.177619 Transcript_74615/m.177619 type:complete len:87 (+) Transcript_74615:898-1158(+)
MGETRRLDVPIAWESQLLMKVLSIGSATNCTDEALFRLLLSMGCEVALLEKDGVALQISSNVPSARVVFCPAEALMWPEGSVDGDS